MQIIRTPEEHFENLPDFPYKPNYINIKNMRVHYLDEGEGETILCLHGEPSWSYLYRKFIPILSPNYRVVCPDLIGFGKSDKLLKKSQYTFGLHYDVLHEFVQKMDLKDVTLVVQDWGGLLGLSLLGQHPDWFKRVVVMNTFLPIGERKPNAAFSTWVKFAKYSPVFNIGKIIQRATYTDLSDEVIAAYNAPFPSSKYKAGARIFPAIVPMKPGMEGISYMKKAREVLGAWEKPAIVLFSDKDPILGGARKFFVKMIPTAEDKEEYIIRNGGHFLQEDRGEVIADHILNFMKN